MTKHRSKIYKVLLDDNEISSESQLKKLKNKITSKMLKKNHVFKIQYVKPEKVKTVQKTAKPKVEKPKTPPKIVEKPKTPQKKPRKKIVMEKSKYADD